jgi:hypothetical protein
VDFVPSIVIITLFYFTRSFAFSVYIVVHGMFPDGRACFIANFAWIIARRTAGHVNEMEVGIIVVGVGGGGGGGGGGVSTSARWRFLRLGLFRSWNKYDLLG